MNLFFVSSLIKNKLREIRLLLKYYHFHTAYPFPAIIFMVDGRCAHGGLVDRFKGIVTGLAPTSPRPPCTSFRRTAGEGVRRLLGSRKEQQEETGLCPVFPLALRDYG